MSDDFERLLDELVPGAGRRDASHMHANHIDAPDFPRDLGLEPRDVLARGGSGWVFRAWDPVLQREVAVKIARPDLGVPAQELLLFEARRTAALDHPSVLPVHRMVVANGQVCVEFRLAPRTTLDALLADPAALAQRDIPGRLVLLRGPIRALHRAHIQGMVHGDLHPGNLVMGEDDAVYLLDWGGPGAGAATAGQRSSAAAPATPRPRCWAGRRTTRAATSTAWACWPGSCAPGGPCVRACGARTWAPTRPAGRTGPRRPCPLRSRYRRACPSCPPLPWPWTRRPAPTPWAWPPSSATPSPGPSSAAAATPAATRCWPGRARSWGATGPWASAWRTSAGSWPSSRPACPATRPRPPSGPCGRPRTGSRPSRTSAA